MSFNCHPHCNYCISVKCDYCIVIQDRFSICPNYTTHVSTNSNRNSKCTRSTGDMDLANKARSFDLHTTLCSPEYFRKTSMQQTRFGRKLYIELKVEPNKKIYSNKIICLAFKVFAHSELLPICKKSHSNEQLFTMLYIISFFIIIIFPRFKSEKLSGYSLVQI